MTLTANTVADREVAVGLLRELLRSDRRLVEQASALRPVGTGRAWVRVADTPGADAWLIAWSPGSSVGTHDHGESHGVVHVLRGSLVERYWTSDDPAPRIRRLARRSTVDVPPDRVHDVANESGRPALSLHVYSPRLTTMSFYPPRASAESW